MLLPDGSSPSHQLSFVRSVRKDDCRGLYTRTQPRSRTDWYQVCNVSMTLGQRRSNCFEWNEGIRAWPVPKLRNEDAGPSSC